MRMQASDAMVRYKPVRICISTNYRLVDCKGIVLEDAMSMMMQASDAMVCYVLVYVFVSAVLQCSRVYTTAQSKSSVHVAVFFILVSSSCTAGNITLMNGRCGMEGRVEMCRDGVWGAVYGYRGWDFNAAQVTCQQLGYPSNCELASSLLSQIENKCH